MTHLSKNSTAHMMLFRQSRDLTICTPAIMQGYIFKTTNVNKIFQKQNYTHKV